MEKGRLLFVEDDDAVREDIASLIASKEWDVVTACDGVDGLAQFRSSGADVVLTDLMMPHMNGLGLLREIHAIDPGTPVIVLTGFSTVDQCREALRSGAMDFIPKPPDFVQLLEQLNHALALRRESYRMDEIRTSASHHLQIDLPPDIARRDAVALQIAAAASSAGFEKKHWAIRLAVDEAFSNAVKHGRGQGKPIHIEAHFDGHEARVSVKDDGIGFDPDRINDSPFHGQPGGRGLFLLRSFCDEVRWRDRGTICEMIFRSGIADSKSKAAS